MNKLSFFGSGKISSYSFFTIIMRQSLLILISLALLVACTPDSESQNQGDAEFAEELTYYDWEDDMPEIVLELFEQEYGVHVNYIYYDTQEEAIESIRAGNVYDIVILDNDYLIEFTNEGLFAEINFSNVPNFKNISPNFRDLAYDPGNLFSIPWSWGSTALVVRSDLLDQPIRSWADIWSSEFNGMIGLRDEPRDQFGAVLKSLGYSINTNNPVELQEAYEILVSNKDRIIIVDEVPSLALPLLMSGEIVAMVGWAEDVLEGQEENENIDYVIPEEGPMLWGDNFALPANSSKKTTAEAFLNFVLRPDIAGLIVNETNYASANSQIYDFLDPEIRDNKTIFPEPEALRNSEVFLSLDDDITDLYDEVWDEFLASLE